MFLSVSQTLPTVSVILHLSVPCVKNYCLNSKHW